MENLEGAATTTALARDPEPREAVTPHRDCSRQTELDDDDELNNVVIPEISDDLETIKKRTKKETDRK